MSSNVRTPTLQSARYRQLGNDFIEIADEMDRSPGSRIAIIEKARKAVRRMSIEFMAADQGRSAEGKGRLEISHDEWAEGGD